MSGLPPGFHFFPSDEELVFHFLYRKVALLPCQPDIIPVLDLYNSEPWQLNGKALDAGNRYYFFSRKTKNRVTANGYWMSTDTDELVTSGSSNVGVKKALVFYVGKPSHEGVKTNWIMHEYHLLDEVLSNSSSRPSKKRSHTKLGSNKWILCRVYEESCGGAQGSFFDNSMELSCLDEVYLSMEDDFEETSYPK